MSARDDFETDLLRLLFQNTNIANIGDATGLRGSSTAGNFYVALFTDAPEDSSGGVGTECDYTGYARVAVARSAVGWTIVGNNVSNAAAVTFGQCSAGVADLAVAFGICTSDVEDADDVLLYGDLTSSLNISVGVTPEFAIGDLDVNVD